MALQMYNDGTWNVLYDEKRIVELRDFFAGLTNTLTETATAYLSQQQADEERLHKERADRARNLAFPVSRAASIEKEKQRVNNVLPMMGKEPVPEAAVLAKPTSVAPPKKPLVPPKPNRVVMTDKGPLEVAPDVSDEDIRGLGYTLTQDDQPGDSQDQTDTTGGELSDSPEEVAS